MRGAGGEGVGFFDQEGVAALDIQGVLLVGCGGAEEGERDLGGGGEGDG